MRMKRWIGLLLALVMVLGLFPATALAEGDTISALPEGYSPMYYQFTTGKYGADIEVNINSRTALVDNLFADSNGSTKLDVTTFLFSFSGTNLGNVVDGGRCWDTNSNAVAGTSGYLYAINDTQKYAIPVAIRADTSTEGSGDNEGDSSGNTGTEDTPSIETTITIDGKEYVRLYRAIIDDDSNVNYFDTAQCAAGGDTGLKLCYYDGSQYVFINNTDYECTYVYGDLDWNNKNTEFVWQPRITGVGKTGYIFATKGDEKYAFPVTVSNPEFGVYTQIPNTQDLTQNYIEGNSGNYTVPYDMEKGTTVHIYWAAGISACTNQTSGVAVEIKDPSSDDSNLTDTNIISVSLPASDKISTTIELSITNKYANNTKTVKINFQSPTAPGGKPWMYDGDGNTSISQPAGGGSDIALKLSDGTAITGGTEGYTLSVSSDALGSVGWNADGSAMNWVTETAVPGTSGYIYATKGDVTYAIAATVNLPDYGLYSAVPTDGYSNYIQRINGAATVNFISGESKTVYLYTNNSNITFNETGYGSDNNTITVSRSNDGRTLEVTLSANNTGTINTLITCPATKNNSIRDWSYRIIFTDGTDTGSGGNQGNTDNTIQAAPLTEAQKWPGIVSQALNPQMGPDEFIYDGQRYLIGFGGEQPSFFGDGTKDWDAVDGNGYFIHIWTQDQQGSYHRVGSELEATLLSKFENLTYTLYGAQWGDSSDSVRLNYPAYYPAYRAEEYGMSYTFTNQNSGCWIMELTGKIGEQTVQALVRDIIEFIPTYTYEAASIEAANAYIVNTLAPIETVSSNYVITLPATTLYGTIVIDDLKARLPITIQGTTDENGAHTVLYGGIYANGGGNIYLKNLELVGAGKDKPSWGENSYAIDASTPNKGLYGQTTTNYTDCIFRDYYIAVECTAGLRWGGRNTQFLNNRIGVYLNRNYANGGATQMDWFLFKNNDVAIMFQEWGTSSVLPMSAYQIRNTKFIGNGKDIVNLTRKWFFLPGNYFVKDVGPVFSAKDPFGPMTLATEEETTYVSAFPYASNENFGGLVYDTKAVISNSLAKDWLIPESSLTTDTTLTVIDESSNETAAVWSFGT